MSDPYRTPAILPEIPQDKSEKVLFVYGEDTRYCPVCDQCSNNWDSSERHKKELCTPFSRVVVRRYWFKSNIICNLEGSHYHCWCYNKECKTHWIVIQKETLEVQRYENKYIR